MADTPVVNAEVKPTYEQLLAKVQELQRKQANATTGKLTFKVSEKGGVSCYGLGRFPVTLYETQWTRLMDVLKAPADSPLRAFLTEHADKLAKKE